MAKTTFIKEPFKYFYETLIIAATVISSATTIYAAINKTEKVAIGIDVNVLADVLNLFVLIMFYFLVKPVDLNLDQGSKQTLSTSLNIPITAIDHKNDRVNRLVQQLATMISYFIFFLILFYVIQIIKDAYHLWDNGVRSDLEKTHSINDLIDKSKKPALYFVIFEFFENLVNIISAAFLFLSFKVLYDVTLDDNNRPIIKPQSTILFLLGYVIIYSISLVIGLRNLTLDQTSHMFRLVCGFYNGLTMSLLFGRLTSMEYFFRDMNWHKGQLMGNDFGNWFFYFGVIFILPLYVIAQPMYGVFYATQFPESFKAFIFIICFIGKGFFLLFFFKYSRYRWLHIYLHMVLANNAIPKNIANELKQVKNLGNKNEED